MLYCKIIVILRKKEIYSLNFLKKLVIIKIYYYLVGVSMDL